MTEEFIQFIWKYGFFEHTGLLTDSGEEIEVISLGEHNQDSGPDFLNARIRIGTTTWAGNVEIHLRSGDWYVHGHQDDKAYDNVILHVVYQHNRPVTRSSGDIIPTLVLPCHEKLYNNYRVLVGQKGSMACREKIRKVDPLLLECWLSSMVVERLQHKAGHITGYLSRNTANWDDAFYISLARSFGFGLNAGPFELVARSLPLTILSRHKNDPVQVEALVMGQAGFLDEGCLYPGHFETMKREYLHLRRKYNLKPVEKHLWKFLRLRPVNFPTVRLAQFAMLILQSGGLFSRILECQELRTLKQFFAVCASEFWDSHYTFDKTSAARVKILGGEAVNSILINTVIPFLFVYGSQNGRDDIREKALNWLNHLPPESNRVIRKWEEAGIKPSSAFYSQSLLQLAENYCKRRRCLACSIGTRIITTGIR